ncbi:MAG TPA: response regulator [Pseudomonadales bacterium]|nr:response regulator [Pseudomonadales bacterium]
MKTQATILLVEDDHASTVVASTMLTREGYNVICVENGRDGLDIAQTDRADLIVLDLNLPLFSGQQFLDARMQCPIMKHIPCIVTSAHAQSHYIDEAKKLGADLYFTKPLDWPCIVNAINAILSSSVRIDLAKTAG